MNYIRIFVSIILFLLAGAAFLLLMDKLLIIASNVLRTTNIVDLITNFAKGLSAMDLISFVAMFILLLWGINRQGNGIGKRKL